MVHEKAIYRGDYLQMWTWTVCRFQGWTGQKRGVGTDTPMHPMESQKVSKQLTMTFFYTNCMLLVSLNIH